MGACGSKPGGESPGQRLAECDAGSGDSPVHVVVDDGIEEERRGGRGEVGEACVEDEVTPHPAAARFAAEDGPSTASADRAVVGRRGSEPGSASSSASIRDQHAWRSPPRQAVRLRQGDQARARELRATMEGTGGGADGGRAGVGKQEVQLRILRGVYRRLQGEAEAGVGDGGWWGTDGAAGDVLPPLAREEEDVVVSLPDRSPVRKTRNLPQMSDLEREFEEARRALKEEKVRQSLEFGHTLSTPPRGPPGTPPPPRALSGLEGGVPKISGALKRRLDQRKQELTNRRAAGRRAVEDDGVALRRLVDGHPAPPPAALSSVVAHVADRAAGMPNQRPVLHERQLRPMSEAKQLEIFDKVVTQTEERPSTAPHRTPERTGRPSRGALPEREKVSPRPQESAAMVSPARDLPSPAMRKGTPSQSRSPSRDSPPKGSPARRQILMAPLPSEVLDKPLDEGRGSPPERGDPAGDALLSTSPQAEDIGARTPELTFAQWSETRSSSQRRKRRHSGDKAGKDAEARVLDMESAAAVDGEAEASSGCEPQSLESQWARAGGHALAPLPLDTRPGFHISVCVRKRPLLPGEGTDVIEVPVNGGQTCVVLESKTKVDMTRYVKKTRFHFDSSFSEGSTNQEIFTKEVAPLVDLLVEKPGSKCSVIAYGPTGTGKTYTIQGTSPGCAEDGLMGHALERLFDHHLAMLAEEARPSVTISAFEIYKGRVGDLLDEGQELQTREDAVGLVHVVPATEVTVSGRSEVMHILDHCMAHRSTEATAANSTSSRSHAVYQLVLKFPDGKRSKLALIDLAGSERAAVGARSGSARAQEGAEINKSLLALKECIRAMTNHRKGAHLPFRQSPLTLILRESFLPAGKDSSGAPCRVVLFANVGPCARDAFDTLNTLRYAERMTDLRSPAIAGAPPPWGVIPQAPAAAKVAEEVR